MANHPMHPATVHFPIAFVTLTGVLDMLFALASHPMTSSLVVSTFKALEVPIAPAALPHFSYYVNLLALFSFIPAVATGVPELLPLIKRDGFKTKKAQTAVTHAAMNDLTAGLLAYNWWTRRSEVGFTPSTTNLAVSGAVALPMVMFAAYLGGSLVYDYGMGVGRGSSKANKAQ